MRDIFGKTAALALLILCNAPANASEEPGRLEKCIGGICLEQKGLTEQKLVERFGQGKLYAPDPEDPDFVVRCYYEPSQDAWIEFKFDRRKNYFNPYQLITIFVSREPLCEKTSTPAKPFAELKTRSGLKLGSAEQEIVRVKGPPSRVADAVLRETKNPKLKSKSPYAAKYGEKVYVYGKDPEGDLLANSYHVTDGKIKSIWLSVSE
jgi:hypothetical protein